MLFELRVVDGGHPDVAAAMQAYFDELDATFPRGFDPGDAIQAAAKDFNLPNGVMVLVYGDSRLAGCAGLSLVDGRTAEVKRMWVAPWARGAGLGRRLLRRLEEEAVDLHRSRLVLDTNGTLTPAIALYESSGFHAIERYNDNPYAERWFEKHLT